MSESRSAINQFLVDVFNDILRIEEQCLAGQFPDLSVKEAHVIDAVSLAANGRSADIARALGVTAGTLTAAVIPLEKKGYLIRQRDPGDKRVIRLLLTPLGEKADRAHRAFHDELVDGALSALSEGEQEVLARALSGIRAFFAGKYPNLKKENNL